MFVPVEQGMVYFTSSAPAAIAGCSPRRGASSSVATKRPSSRSTHTPARPSGP